MSALLLLLVSVLSGHAHIVEHDAPTGDLRRGDVLIELHTPPAQCLDRGGRPFLSMCIGEDF